VILLQIFVENIWAPILRYSDGSYVLSGLGLSGACTSGFGLLLNDGTAIALSHPSSSCTSTSISLTSVYALGPGDKQVCTTMLVDVNGQKKPNQIGKDIYGIAILKDRTIPYSNSLYSVLSASGLSGYLNSTYYLSQ
jgi:hypothetical protein